MLQRNLLEENSYFKQLYVWLPISWEPHGEWGLCLLWLSAAVPSLDKVPSGCPLGASHRPPAQTHTPFTSSHGDLLWKMMHVTKELLLLLQAWKGRQAVPGEWRCCFPVQSSLGTPWPSNTEWQSLKLTQLPIQPLLMLVPGRFLIVKVSFIFYNVP